MRRTIAATLLISLFIALGCHSASAQVDNRKYYIDGKRIAPPAQPPPFYPDKEHRRRIGGTTVVAYTHDAAGKVLTAEVKSSSGNKNLDDAAVAAVLKWVIPVVLKDGMAVAGASETPITFIP